MKQKNMLLVAVAVVCGLVAAVLTSQVAAGNKSKAEPTVLVLEAVKDLPVGTWIKGDTVNEYVALVDTPQSQVPPEFISSTGDVADKKVIRTMRKGDKFNPKDVSKVASMAPPAGFNMIAVGCTLEEAVAGFVQPGSKVHILASIPSKKDNGKYAVVTFMYNMLVLAVDGQATPSQEGPSVVALNSVSLAVKQNQWELLHAAKTRGCIMRLVLVNPKDEEKVPADALNDKDLWALLTDTKTDNAPPASKGEAPQNNPPESNGKPAEEKVKLAVAREDLAAGTELTPEVITEKFEMKEFTKPAPANGIENLRDYTGKFLTKDLAQGQFVPKSFLGKDPKAAPKAAPNEDATNKEEDMTPKVEPKKPEAPPVYLDVVVQSGSGTRKLRYQVLPNGEYVFQGEIPLNSPTQGGTPPKSEKKEEKPAAPAPKAEPAKPETKPAAPAPEQTPSERI
ncbi:MAG: Flp pilus assembly protein CpaB [Fimbriiglobus sp.]